MIAGLLLGLVLGWAGESLPRADLVEVNTFYDPAGEVRFVQVICWEWLPDYGRHCVRDWRLIDDWWVQGEVVTVVSGCQQREVRCRLFRQTWTYFDPEQADRHWMAENRRIRVW